MPSFKNVGGSKKKARKQSKTRVKEKKVKKVKATDTHKLSWIEACKKMGYMKKGADFKPLPAKGSAAYDSIVAARA